MLWNSSAMFTVFIVKSVLIDEGSVIMAEGQGRCMSAQLEICCEVDQYVNISARLENDFNPGMLDAEKVTTMGGPVRVFILVPPEIHV